METFITPEYFELITEQEAKFILDHAEKQLKDILDTSLLIANRSVTLLTLVVGLIVGLIGFSISHYETLHHYNELIFVSSWGAVYLFAAAVVIILNFVPKSYYVLGAEPKDFFEDRVFNKANSEYRIVAIYVNEIIQTQIKINNGKRTNNNRWRLFNVSLFLIGSLPLIIGGLYWLSIFLF